MSLRLALVLDGNPTGAKKALTETGQAIDELARKSKTAGDNAGEVGKRFDWADSAPAKINETATKTGQLSEAMGDAVAKGGGLPDVIRKTGEAAGEAEPKMGAVAGSLKAMAVSFAAGFGVGVLVQGLNAAVGEVAKYVKTLFSDQAQIESNLKAQAELVRDIKRAYAEAAGGASSYGRISSAGLRFDAQQSVNRLTKDRDAALGGVVNGGTFGATGAFNEAVISGGGTRDFLGPLRKSVLGFRQDVREGKADVTDFLDEVARIAQALPAESPYRTMAESIRADLGQVADIEAARDQAKDLLDGLRGDAEATATALGGTEDKYRSLGEAASGAAAPIGDSAAGLDAAGTAANSAVPGIEATAGSFAQSGEAAGAAAEQINAYSTAIANIPAAPRTSAPRTSVPQVIGNGGGGYASGGATGADGPDTAIDGYVHKNEFVFSAPATRRLGTGLLNTLHQAGKRGYAAGGVVSGGGFGAASGAAGDNVVQGTASDFNILRGSVAQLTGAILRGATAGDALKQVLISLADKWIDKFTSMLDAMIFDNAPGFTANGGGIGGFLSSLFGGGFPPAPAPPIGLYDVGGATGTNGPDTAIDGYVHKNEFVFSAPATRRLGTGFLNSLHQAGKRGFQDGGAVGAGGYGAAATGPLVVINNNSSAQISQKEESDGRGGRRLVMELSDMVASGINRPGSSLDKAIARRGAKQVLTRR